MDVCVPHLPVIKDRFKDTYNMDVCTPSAPVIKDHLTILFKEIGQLIRADVIDVGRKHYALSLAHGVRQALHSGYSKIVAIELGVASGDGLLDLCKAAEYFRKILKIEIDVYGFDTGIGLPPCMDYRDHPEIWREGLYNMGDVEALRNKLPSFAKLIIGDVGETIPQLESQLGDAKIGFVAFDLDFYSSATRAMKLFNFAPERYVPALPIYFDDVDSNITYNEWCGEGLAISEFNSANTLRKIERKRHFSIPSFYVCHVFDHPIRTGLIKPRMPFAIFDF